MYIICVWYTDADEILSPHVSPPPSPEVTAGPSNSGVDRSSEESVSLTSQAGSIVKVLACTQ